MKLCAHLGFQFNEFEGFERIAQAAKAGFRAAEWPGIYGFAQGALVDTLQRHQLAWPQVTLPLGDAAKGDKGITALRGRQDQFRSDLELAIDYAKKLKAAFIHPMSGVGCDLRDDINRQTYVENLRLAHHRAKQEGLNVLVEVISQESVPGYAMCSYELARTVFDEVPGLYLLLDVYHAKLIKGDPCATIARWTGQIGHVQIADSPGRHEPGTGQIDFAAVEAALTQAGYSGWVGCEYKPATNTIDGLAHLRQRAWL